MLPDSQYRLLTAAIDGELGPTERAVVQRLLRESHEANRVYNQLQSDSRSLRQLPRHNLPVNFAHDVLKTITEKGLIPNSTVEPRRRIGSSLPAWASLASAASVLLLIGAMSFYYFLVSRQPADPAPVIAGKVPAPKKVNSDRLAADNSASQVAKALEVSGDPSGNTAERDERPDPMSPKLKTPHDQLTGREPDKLEPFRVVDVRLPFISPFADLDTPDVRERLLKQVRSEPTAHLELFCRDGGKALERVEAALKAAGQKPLIDATAQERLKRKLPREEFVVFTENLTSDELVHLLQQLGSDAKLPSPGVFDTLVLNPTALADQRELFRALGPAKADPAKGPAGVDIRKPISDGTGSQLTASLTGQGSGTKPATKPNEKLALVLPFHAVKLDPKLNALSREVRGFLDASKEVKQFQASRPAERRPGTMSVLLILRIKSA
jgi:hypothetical protein